MTERQLSDAEVKQIYGQIVDAVNLEPFDRVVEVKYSELNGKQYRLI